MDCIFTMNEVGAFIWENLDGQATVADLQAAVVEQYEVDPEAAATDLLEFVRELGSAGAVRRC
jgi:hypothetical protein